MKIDFSKIEIEDIEGNKVPVDVSKELGNMLWVGAQDIAVADLGRDIYHKREVELTKEQARVIRGFIDTPNTKAIFKRVLLPLLDGVDD